ncbi:hypothetical protein JRQ81_017763 [Phrynocephalus forsythii]|uniref:Uncharacterized protein n=1 Tax=Phrynocephalus forsythii TaxID=171643 RepID=A0A9Q0XS01_9SAUR|nr:hypothetical protein JRQ81_017763 [Phrynocephalus forsythii]
MSFLPPFKKCISCGAKIAHSDRHLKCLFCLGEVQKPEACSICRSFSTQALKNRQNRLNSYLLEKPLTPVLMEQAKSSLSTSLASSSVSKSLKQSRTRKLSVLDLPSKSKSSSDSIKPPKILKSSSDSKSSDVIVVKTKYSDSAPPLSDRSEFQQLRPSSSSLSDLSSKDEVESQPLNISLMKEIFTPACTSTSPLAPGALVPSNAISSPVPCSKLEEPVGSLPSNPVAFARETDRTEKKKKHHKKVHLSTLAVLATEPLDPLIHKPSDLLIHKSKSRKQLSLPAASDVPHPNPSVSILTTVTMMLMGPEDISDPSLVPATQPPQKKQRTSHRASASASIPVPPIPAFSLRFYGKRWSIHSSDSSKLDHPSNPSSSELSSDSDFTDDESISSDSKQLVTMPDSETEERSPPSSSEAISNYTDFVARMAKTINLPIHHPRPRHTCHIFGKISSDQSAPIHLTIIPSFTSMAEEAFKTIGSMAVSRKIEALYKVHDEKATYLTKHPQPNSVVVASSQIQSRTKQVPIPPSKEGHKLDTVGRNVYNFTLLLLKIANYQGTMGAYQCELLAHLQPFLALIPESKRSEAALIFDEAMALSAQQMCTSRHAFDCTTKIMGAAIGLRRHAWLRTTGLSDDHKAQIENLPFEGDKLFHPTTDDLMEDHHKKQNTAKKTQRSASTSATALSLPT